MAGRAFGPEGDCGLDHFNAGTGGCEDKVVHHLIDVVEEQFHLFAGSDVKGDGIVLQARLDSEAKLGCFQRGQAK